MPLSWKSKTITQVCRSPKAAETRAADLCADNAVFLARVVKEIYSGRRGYNQLDVELKTDSKSLLDTLESTKQVEEKLIRPVVTNLKEMITRKWITSMKWIGSENCHADVLTKKGSKWSDKILKIMTTGRNQWT